MERFISLSEENEEARRALPIIPLAFGNGEKIPESPESHLLLSVRQGSVLLATEAGEEEVCEGMMLFVRQGHFPEFSEKSADFDCEFVLFDATEAFLAHLELPDVAAGEVGEGGGISSAVKMSNYALEYYHDSLKICAAVYASLAKIARDLMLSRLERFDTLSERLSPAILQIEQRYAEPLTVRVLAHSCSMSESVFGRAFKRVYGCTPIQYLIRVRLEAAKALLAGTDRDFEDIALCCGFGSAKYFGDMLKKNEHVSPRELRAMYRSMTQISFF